MLRDDPKTYKRRFVFARNGRTPAGERSVTQTHTNLLTRSFIHSLNVFAK